MIALADSTLEMMLNFIYLSAFLFSLYDSDLQNQELRCVFV